MVPKAPRERGRLISAPIHFLKGHDVGASHLTYDSVEVDPHVTTASGLDVVAGDGQAAPVAGGPPRRVDQRHGAGGI
jgi:hypothetical protein